MLQAALIGLLRFYQRSVSPLTPPTCRFTPTCSEYALRAVERHGAARGGWLGAKRIVRCRPWGGFGWDPVPQVDDAGRVDDAQVDDTSRVDYTAKIDHAARVAHVAQKGAVR